MALMDGKTILDLTEGLQLRRVLVMGANRIEMSGFNDAMRDRLRAYGLFHEIISWKLRMFVTTDTTGAAILTKGLECSLVARIGKRDEGCWFDMTPENWSVVWAHGPWRRPDLIGCRARATGANVVWGENE